MDVQNFYRKKNRENIDSDSDLSEVLMIFQFLLSMKINICLMLTS